MAAREQELTDLILALADRLEICSRLLGKCAERRTTKGRMLHMTDDQNTVRQLEHVTPCVEMGVIKFGYDNPGVYITRGQARIFARAVEDIVAKRNGPWEFVLPELAWLLRSCDPPRGGLT